MGSKQLKEEFSLYLKMKQFLQDGVKEKIDKFLAENKLS
jgi:hypothetical protein